MSPEKIRQLAGVVTDVNGDAISGATVEDCDSTFGNVLVTRKTDGKGRFSFPKAKRGTRHYLQVVIPGFNLTRIPLTVDRDGEDQLRVRLTVGT